MALRWRLENLDLELETRRLILLLRETERSLLAFALYRTVAEREAVARELRERLPLPVQEFTLTAARRNPFDLIEGVKTDGRVACFVYDVEEAFPEALGYLNMQRERLTELPHAVVFWVREYGLREIGVQAPDFWAWRSGVFDFRAPQERAPLAAVEMAVAEPFTYLDRGDLERRLSLYRGLLEDYSLEERPDEAFLAELERKIGQACYYLGEWAEARAHWQRALEISERAGDEEGRAVALHNLGILAQRQGDYAAARCFYQQSLEITQVMEDQAGLASTLHQLGTLDQAQGDYAAARHFYQQSLEITQALEDQAWVALTTWGLGNIAYDQGDYDEARGKWQEALAVFEELGDRKNKAGMLHQLGLLAQAQGDYAAAHRFYQRSLEIKQALGDRAGVATSTAQMALLEEAEGNVARALELIRQAEATFRQLSSPMAEQARQERERLEQWMGSERYNNE